MAMYELEQVKELINTIDKTGVTCFEIKSADGERLTIKKETYAQTLPVQAATQATAVTAAVQTSVVKDTATDDTATDDTATEITAPMVGVFYAAASPEADPFVSVGSAVKKGDVICIIEAMKLMNEITAAHSGTIAEICVQNGDIVEFGQPLFKIR